MNSLTELLQGLPYLDNQKEPVMTMAELYVKYPDGGQFGWYAFVHEIGSFAYWSTTNEEWTGDEALIFKEAAEAAKIAAETAQGLSEDARDASIQAKDESVSAKNTSVSAASTATTKANEAAQSAIEADNSADLAESSKTAAQSAQVAAEVAQEVVENLAQNIGLGSPKGVYANLAALVLANPPHDYIYLTSDNGHWNYWNGSTWTDGGLWQSPLDIVQTTGTSETKVMSQKATETFYVNKNDYRFLGLPLSITEISNFYISSTTGEPVSNSGSKHSDYIDISAYKKLKINSDAWPGGQFRAVVFYNDAKDTKYKPLKLDGSVSDTYTMRDSSNNITNNGECLIPEGAKWVRFTIQAIAVIGNTFIYGYDKTNDLLIKTFKKRSEQQINIGYEIKSNFQISTIGTLVQTTGAKLTVIDVRGYDKLIISGDKPVAANDTRGCVFYANKQALKPLRSDGQTCSIYSIEDNSGNYAYQGEVKIPDGAEYMAITVNVDNSASALTITGYLNERLRNTNSVESNLDRIIDDSFEYSHNKRVELAYTRVNGSYLTTDTGVVTSLANTARTGQIAISDYKFLFIEAEKPTNGTAIVEMTRGVVFYGQDGTTKIKPVADNESESAGYYMQDELYNTKYQGLLRVPDGAYFVDITIQSGNYANYVNNFRIWGGERILTQPTNDYSDFVTKQYIQFQVNTKLSQDFTGNELVVKDAENLDTDYGVVMLPTSYSKTGSPTRLVIMCHGGGGTVGKDYLGYMFSYLEQQILAQYLVSQGYAVMDVGGLPKQFAYDNSLDWYRVGGSPIAMQSYEKAYRYITDNYNICKDGVIISGGSNGALTGMNIVQYSSIPVRCVGFYAPLISMQNLWSVPSGKSWNDAHGLNSFGDLPAGLFTGYQNRANIIKLYGLGNPTTQQQVNDWVYDDTKLKSFDPFLQGVVTDNDGNKCKIFKAPIKLWISTSDPVIDETAVSDLAAMINRAGGYAILRQVLSDSHDPQLAGTPVGTFTYNGQTQNIYPVAQEILLWFNRYK
jgi:hypothetical protein